jgi:hypothetical protein
MSRASRAARPVRLLPVLFAIPCLLLVPSTSGLLAQSKKNAEKAEKKVDKKASEKAARDVAAEKALLRATAKAQASHLKELESVAAWAATNGLKDDASKLVATMRKIDPEYPGLAKAKAAADKSEPQKDEAKLSELKTSLAKRVDDANDKNAKRLFELATSCMKLGLFTAAFDLINDVIEADPDHKKARDILGYAWEPTSKTWITKWEADMRKKAFLTDEGWVKKEDKAKWDKGLREYAGKWVTKEEEERIRKRNEYNPFTVESEHFQVQTNLGRKQALEFANLLEDFHHQFFRFYVGFYDQVAGAKLLFNQAKNAKRHVVKVFPSQVEYLTFVKAEKGNNQLLRDSGGFFAPEDRCSYFYWSEREQTLDTLYHEVTHQLFGETKPQSGGSQGNNWVVEGIASYMETWEKIDGKWLPGHKLDSPRLGLAKGYLAKVTGWSLASFIRIDHHEFHETDRGLNYALSAALCHFLLHGEEGIYRDPFIQFISAYYGGKVVEDSLGKYLKVEGVTGPAETIQAIETQFKAYMSHLGEPDKSATPTPEEGASAGK